MCVYWTRSCYIQDVTNYAHHFCFIAGVGAELFMRGEFMYFGVLQAIIEGSSPFVNWRFTLIETGMKDSIWYTFASLGMMVSFLFCRMVKMPWHWYALYDAIFSLEGAKVSMLFIIQVLINCVFFSDALNV